MRVSPRFFFVLIVCLPAAAAAQTSPTPPAEVVTPAPSPVAGKSWRDLIAFEGLVDTYGSYRPAGGALEDATKHVFDTGTGSFILNYAEFALGMKPQPVGFRFDMGVGNVADATASNIAPPPMLPEPTFIEMYKHVQQAYISFALPWSLALDVGKFVTPLGAEVIEARMNWNYSRSFLFFQLPFTQTGFRLTAPVLPSLTLQAFVTNGWDLVYDNNPDKTYGLTFIWNAPFGSTITLNGMAGNEVPQGMGTQWRYVADLIVSHTLGPIGLLLNADFGHQGDFNWYGVAGYARVALGAHFYAAVRGEVLRDEGFRINPAIGTRVEEITLTAGFPISDYAEVRLENRNDFSNQPIFIRDDQPETEQFQLLAAALLWF